jgi:hypothetical protein
MSPSEKLARYRNAVPAQVRKRWPTPLTPSAEQLAELTAISSPAARLARYREMQAEAQQAPAPGGDEAA